MMPSISFPQDPHTLNLRKVIFLTRSCTSSPTLSAAGSPPLRRRRRRRLTPVFPFVRVSVACHHEADSSSQAVALLLLNNKTPFQLGELSLFLHPTYRFPSRLLRCSSSSPHTITRFAPYNDRI